MKWVKISITFIIAIMTLPLLIVTITNLTQETENYEVITFEILTTTSVTPDTFEKMVLFYYEGANYNLNIYINDILHAGSYAFINENTILVYMNGYGEALEIYNDDTIEIIDYPFVIGDIIEVNGPVTTPPILSGTTATLILLIPLIFTAGLVWYFYKKTDNEEK